MNDEIELSNARIEFRITDGPNHPRGRPVVVPHIDGQDLGNIVRPVELAQGAGDLAGKYAGVPLTNPRNLDFQYLSRSVVDTYEATIVVLGCTCGVVDCWPLQVHIEVNPELVTWRSFEHYYRPWDYSSLGPFRFNRTEYTSGLAHIRSVLAHDRIAGW